MMIGSEDSRSPLGRPSSLVPPMTLQPLHSMCSGAVSPPQCFPAGVPTGDIPADLWAALLHNAAVPCWRLFDSGTHGHVASATHAVRLVCRPGMAPLCRPQNSIARCLQLKILSTILAYCVCNKPGTDTLI